MSFAYKVHPNVMQLGGGNNFVDTTTGKGRSVFFDVKPSLQNGSLRITDKTGHDKFGKFALPPTDYNTPNHVVAHVDMPPHNGGGAASKVNSKFEVTPFRIGRGTANRSRQTIGLKVFGNYIFFKSSIKK